MSAPPFATFCCYLEQGLLRAVNRPVQRGAVVEAVACLELGTGLYELQEYTSRRNILTVMMRPIAYQPWGLPSPPQLSADHVSRGL